MIAPSVSQVSCTAVSLVTSPAATDTCGTATVSSGVWLSIGSVGVLDGSVDPVDESPAAGVLAVGSSAHTVMVPTLVNIVVTSINRAIANAMTREIFLLCITLLFPPTFYSEMIHVDIKKYSAYPHGLRYSF